MQDNPGKLRKGLGFTGTKTGAQGNVKHYDMDEIVEHYPPLRRSRPSCAAEKTVGRPEAESRHTSLPGGQAHENKISSISSMFKKLYHYITVYALSTKFSLYKQQINHVRIYTFAAITYIHVWLRTNTCHLQSTKTCCMYLCIHIFCCGYI